MRFPSLSRRTEPAPSTVEEDTDQGGAVATDTRDTDTRSPESRTESRTADTRSRDVRADGSEPGADAARGSAAADRTPNERAAAARAATARSGVDGSRRARNAPPAVRSDLDQNTTPDRSAPRAATAAPAVAASDTTLAPDTTRETERDRDGVGPVRTADRESAPDAPPAPVGPRPRASLLATFGLVVGLAGLGFVLTGTLAGYGIALGAIGAILAVLGMISTRRRHIAGKSDALLGIAFGLGAVVVGVLAMTGMYDWPSTDGDLVARFREWLDSQFADRF
ncbi:UbiA family prenyltransferase [Micromonospora sp. NPDC047134]|uniref:UbiA family prenyltransferase n=1 Tax=Micromonospora sp. NPDC047134 TaxID=3154340 RepID=UPI0033F59CAE